MQNPEVMRIGNDKRTPRMSKAEAIKKIAKMRERDSEKVNGIFKNLENPGTNGSLGMAKFGYKAYPGDDFVFYELYDGQRYTIPRGLARHINNQCCYKEYQHLPNETGAQGVRQGVIDGRMGEKRMQASKKIHRFEFKSLEFLEEDDVSPVDIVEVTVSP